MTSRQKLAGVVLPPEEEPIKPNYGLFGVRVDEDGDSDLRITENGRIRIIEDPYHGDKDA